jgi:2-dehydro-3-deoxyphosphogluconate aldolase / (4S)-4-hydroxy-2-oxoglutarate aldolase
LSGWYDQSYRIEVLTRRLAAVPFPALLQTLRILPVIVLEDETAAGSLGEALVAGGIPLAEVTLRTPAALAAIRTMSRVSGLTVGAGTVLDVVQLRQAVDAGATFVVSPGLSAKVVTESRRLGIDVLPGVAPPSEVMAARDLGVRVVKYFPAESLGGVPSLRAIAAAFPDIMFVPTGGIGPGNAGDYLGLPFVTAVGGSWLASPDLVRRRDWTGVQQAVAASRLLLPSCGGDQP